MSLPVRCLYLSTIEEAATEMARLGVDPVGIRIMAPKQSHFNLKITGLTSAQANILKQEILSAGGEAAVAMGAASCAVKNTDAIVSGTIVQLTRLIEKLEMQPFGLPLVGRAIKATLDNQRTMDYLLHGRSKTWSIGARTLIMGVLNATPDSFSDGGKFDDPDKAIERALRMVEEGADWIDVGGESTRPLAHPVDAIEEKKRILPIVERLVKKGVTISVDTSKASVAQAALDAGAEIINDISALADPQMAGVCVAAKAIVVLMHMRGTPGDMQTDTKYGDLMTEVYCHLLSRVQYAEASGIETGRIVIDPGIGFGKSVEGNLALIKRLAEFKGIGRPILVGASRKSFIGTISGGQEPLDRVEGTIAAHTAAILKGASILRVHDVKAAKRAADMADALL